MKQHIVLSASTLALACALSTTARADESEHQLTREEVVAQTLAARDSGELAVTNAGGSWSAPQKAAAPMTREQVVAATLAARDSGELAVTNTGGSWSGATQAPPPASREQVVGDFMKSRQGPSDASAVEHSI